jgi:glycogen synthase
MKVFMVGWELPPLNSGGLGEACYGLAKALSKKGVAINFILPYNFNIKSDFMNILYAGGKVNSKKILGPYLNYSQWLKAAKLGTVSFVDYLSQVLEYAENIKELARKENADIIHMHDWLTYPAGISAQEILKCPLVAHVHATEFDRTGGRFLNEGVYDIEKTGFEKSDRILPVGGIVKRTITERYGIDQSKIKVIYNGVEDSAKPRIDPALLNFKKLGYKIVLFLGRITMQKGPDYFVKAAAIVARYYPKSVFVVTGSGDMQAQMIREATDFGIIDKFIFTGFLRGNEKDSIYQAADVYVMPSISEPFGITALEAVKNRTPVIVSKQSGVSEVLRSALKVDFWDTEELANKILAILKYKSLPKDLRRESVREIVNLTWDRSADEVIKVYQQLVY